MTLCLAEDRLCTPLLKRHVLCFSRKHTRDTRDSNTVLLTITMLNYQPGFNFTATCDDGVQIERRPTFRKPKHQIKVCNKFCGFSQTYLMEVCKEHDSQLHCILETAACTACFHRKAVFHVITAYRRIVILRFTCFMRVCGIARLLKSSCRIMKRPSVFS